MKKAKFNYRPIPNAIDHAKGVITPCRGPTKLIRPRVPLTGFELTWWTEPFVPSCALFWMKGHQTILVGEKLL